MRYRTKNKNRINFNSYIMTNFNFAKIYFFHTLKLHTVLLKANYVICLIVKTIQTDKKVLEIITYVGLTLSLIGIALTIIGYVFLT